jgi:hypothetical protein
MYIVTSKPKRISVYSGLVHMGRLPVDDVALSGVVAARPTAKSPNAPHDFLEFGGAGVTGGGALGCPA